MISQENKNHGDLLRFMIGWKKGSGGLAFKDDEFDNEHFKAGWEQGRKDQMHAYALACKKYKSELSPIRIEDNIGVNFEEQGNG